MKKYTLLLSLFCILSILLSACGLIPTPAPTVTPTPLPSKTPTATQTFTPSPTATATSTPRPSPTRRPSASPTSHLDDLHYNQAGGYSFYPPKNYIVFMAGEQSFVASPSGLMMFIFNGSTSNPDLMKQNALATYCIGSLFYDEDGNSLGDYKKGIGQKIIIDDIEGASYAITGTIDKDTVQGMAVVVMPNKDSYLCGLGFAYTNKQADLWENYGERIFGEILESLTFGDGEKAGTAASCVISVDETYGYSKDNPIRVGGDAFDGPARERAYLDNLLGAKGENITYERTGSIEHAGSILDVFVIRGLEEDITLYIDEYSFEEPKAPLGFICKSAFPLPSNELSG
jgi:hypothetical protein